MGSVEALQKQLMQIWAHVSNWIVSLDTGIQLGAIVVSFFMAMVMTGMLRRSLPLLFIQPPRPPLLALRRFAYEKQVYLRPILNILCLGIALQATANLLTDQWVLRLGQSLAVSILLYTLITRTFRNVIARGLILWISIPLAVLTFMDWLDPVTRYLDSISMEIGNIRLSALGVIRVVVFGSILFWLGRLSNNAGKRMIRNQADLDIGTREVIAKLFEVGLYVVIFILLLQIMGINITALAVFGGALAVGLGFGLQSIASNFISGMIILLDRSLTVGDFIEMEDGKKGEIRELNMRFTILETYDGKDIMVPNEKFITSTFVNWTHKNHRQRYEIHLQVAYKTDLHRLFPLLRETVSKHPKVISAPGTPIEELPDAEILSFGESGVNILIEFWMEGIDDGRNRVGGDLLLMIWDALRENEIEIPFPQREVRMVS